MAGPVRSDTLARILWRKTHHVLHTARCALTKSDQRVETAQAVCLQAKLCCRTDVFECGRPNACLKHVPKWIICHAQYCLVHRHILFFTGGSECLICRIIRRGRLVGKWAFLLSGHDYPVAYYLDLDPSFWYHFLHTFPYDSSLIYFPPSNLRTNSLGVRYPNAE